MEKKLLSLLLCVLLCLNAVFLYLPADSACAQDTEADNAETVDIIDPEVPEAIPQMTDLQPESSHTFLLVFIFGVIIIGGIGAAAFVRKRSRIKN